MMLQRKKNNSYRIHIGTTMKGKVGFNKEDLGTLCNAGKKKLNATVLIRGQEYIGKVL
jgi:hypothetical protein